MDKKRCLDCGQLQFKREYCNRRGMFLTWIKSCKYAAPNTACTGIAVGSDKPALAVSDTQSVTEPGSPALR